MVATAVLAAVSVALTRPAGERDPEVVDARRAPAFSLPDVRNDSVRVELPEGRPAVVNFLASWCGPCKNELPLFRQAAADHGDEIAFIGVDHLDHRDDAREFLDEFGVTFPVGFDPGGDTAPRYRLRGLPGTVFVRADGTIAAVKHGEIKAKELAERLAALSVPTLQGARQ